MGWPRGALLLLVALLALAATVCRGCTCDKNKRTQNCVVDGDDCRCLSIGSNMTVSCKTLTSKCLLMKAEVSAFKAGRREKPKHAFVDNDGIYNPECDSQGNFNAKQCNGTSTCWCVNSAGVRRTEKSDKNISCSEVVRTSFIFIEMKHLERNTAPENLENTIIDVLSQRYNLNRKHINVTYEKPYITIELKQNTSDKLVSDADIADVAYYFEKDVKGDSLITNDKFEILVAGEPLQLENTVIYYVDEKPPEFSMKRLTAGVIAVIVIVVLAIVAGILVLIFTRRKRGKYEKAEVKELNEIPRELKS